MVIFFFLPPSLQPLPTPFSLFCILPFPLLSHSPSSLFLTFSSISFTLVLAFPVSSLLTLYLYASFFIYLWFSIFLSLVVQCSPLPSSFSLLPPFLFPLLVHLTLPPASVFYPFVLLSLPAILFISPSFPLVPSINSHSFLPSFIPRSLPPSLSLLLPIYLYPSFFIFLPCLPHYVLSFSYFLSFT